MNSQQCSSICFYIYTLLLTMNALVDSVHGKISSVESSRETDIEGQSLGRGLLGIALFTWTETSTTTISHTCTTSTSSLKSCTGVYLRKRAISLGRRRLLYDEQDDDSEDGSAFLPLPEKNKSVASTQLSKTDGDESTQKFLMIPQSSSGFPDSESVSGRLLFFGTTTTTSVTTVTYTNYLTAVCLSSTPWTTCDKK